MSEQVQRKAPAFAWLAPRRWALPIGREATTPQIRATGIGFLLLAALLFPPVINNDGDVDAAANALSFAALALGLNIVVGFAGLLDLGYAAFFAIGAYTYGALASFQLHPAWSDFWQPFAWLGLVANLNGTVHFQVSFWLMMPLAATIAAFFGILFGAPTLRLKGD